MGKTMEESNKVVVKVKYQGLNQPQNTNSRPEMVTEWHIHRILTAVAILLIFILFPFYYFSEQSPELAVQDKIIIKASDTNKSIVKPSKIINHQIPAAIITEKLNTEIKPVIVASKKPEAVIKSNIKLPPVISNKNLKQPNKTDLISEQSKISKSIKSDTVISRALLTTGLNNKEPIDNISSTIKVNEQKATGIYYFTEINNMKGQALYHHWLRDDKLIYKRTIRILGNRWRAATSKLITYSRTGNWTVRLVNKQGTILNEIKFKVIK